MMIEQMTGLVTLFMDRDKETGHRTAASANGQGHGFHREIGPISTIIRLVLGVFLVGFIAYGEISHVGHLIPATWLLGLLGFPALVISWHLWRIRRRSAPFVDDSSLGIVLSLVLPLAVYLLGWLVKPLWFTSDATLIYVGSSLILAGLRGSAGCEVLALSNWLLGRTDQIGCAFLSPIDALDQLAHRS